MSLQAKNPHQNSEALALIRFHKSYGRAVPWGESWAAPPPAPSQDHSQPVDEVIFLQVVAALGYVLGQLEQVPHGKK